MRRAVGGRRGGGGERVIRCGSTTRGRRAGLGRWGALLSRPILCERGSVASVPAGADLKLMGVIGPYGGASEQGRGG